MIEIKNFHTQSPVLINKKEILVDIKIQPIINWLNSFKGIETVWSCEGNNEMTPYVSFIFKNSKSLKEVFKTVCLFKNRNFIYACPHLQIDDKEDLGFSLYFKSKKTMFEFCKFVKKSTRLNLNCITKYGDTRIKSVTRN